MSKKKATQVPITKPDEKKSKVDQRKSTKRVRSSQTEKIVNPKTKLKSKINMKITRNKEKIYSIACIFLIIDQLIKILIKTKMNLLQEITIIPNFFSIYYVENEGAAFSILQNKTIFLIVISIICIMLIDRYLSKAKDLTKLTRISFGILLGGMIGNLIDRLLYGTVTDYLAFNFFSYSFPVFNFADIGITIGVLLIIVMTILDEINIIKSK